MFDTAVKTSLACFWKARKASIVALLVTSVEMWDLQYFKVIPENQNTL